MLSDERTARSATICPRIRTAFIRETASCHGPISRQCVSIMFMSGTWHPFIHPSITKEEFLVLFFGGAGFFGSLWMRLCRSCSVDDYSRPILESSTPPSFYQLFSFFLFLLLSIRRRVYLGTQHTMSRSLPISLSALPISGLATLSISISIPCVHMRLTWMAW